MRFYSRLAVIVALLAVAACITTPERVTPSGIPLLSDAEAQQIVTKYPAEVEATVECASGTVSDMVNLGGMVDAGAKWDDIEKLTAAVAKQFNISTQPDREYVRAYVSDNSDAMQAAMRGMIVECMKLQARLSPKQKTSGTI